MKILIIDDEKRPADNLKMMIEGLPNKVTALNIAHSALEGMNLIETIRPDVIFLDISMPKHTGFELLDAISKKDFQVVFTTAHEEYAIKAIKHRAFDYLLKPIDSDELKNCLDRLADEIALKKSKQTVSNYKMGLLRLPVKDGLLLLKQADVIRVEASGSYSFIFTCTGEKHIITKNLKSMEELLDLSVFFRCHNSHIVNMQRLKRVSRSEGLFIEMEDGSTVEVSRAKKDEFFKRL